MIYQWISTEWAAKTMNQCQCLGKVGDHWDIGSYIWIQWCRVSE